MNYLIIKEYFSRYIHRTTTIRFQTICMTISLILILFMFQRGAANFIFNDPYPEMFYLTPIRQTESGGAVSIVQTGMVVRSFTFFDITNNDFVVDLVVWFEFNSNAISIDTIEKFSFERGSILYKSAPSTKLIGDNIFAKYDVRVKFSSLLNYKYFPFSDHRLYLILINKFISASEMIYESVIDGFIIPESIYASDWVYTGKEVSYGYSKSIVDIRDEKKNVSYPQVVFSMDFQKTGVKYVFLIILPILLMYYMGLFSLSLDPERHGRIIYTLSVGSITSILAYRFVIERMSPAVGYFTISDFIYTYILAVSFFIFLLGIFSTKDEKFSVIMNIIRVISSLLFNFVIVLLIYYLVFVWTK